MKINIMCSCCGRTENVSPKCARNAEVLIERGWGSCGSALYCPECSQGWDKRNPGRNMADKKHTFFVILGLFMDAIREEAAP